MIGTKRTDLEDARGWDGLVDAGRVEPPSAATLLAARNAVHAAVRAAAAHGTVQTVAGTEVLDVVRLNASPVPASAPIQSPARRRGRRLIIAGGLTAAVAVVLIVAPLPFGVGAPPASAEAVSILTSAAAAAQAAPVVPARADQFVFVKSLIASSDSTPEIRTIWLSADGTHPGLLTTRDQSGGGEQSLPISGCLNDVWVNDPSTAGTGKEAIGGPCTTVPAYLRGLPTEAEGMRSYLYANSHGSNPADQQAFITAGDLIRESYLPPAALAAVFAAVATIPGVTVVHDAVDAAGRHGIAVVRVYNGTSAQLIFDPTNFAFLGEREVVVGSGAGEPVGSVLDSSARTQIAIVDHSGELPADGGGQ